MIRIVCLAIGYVFGLFQTGYLFGRAHGIDIRDYGSGNAGTTNMLRTLGKKAGIITFFGDALKCLFAVLLVRFLLASRYPDILPLLSIYTAAGTILGHNFPFYLHFHGGKGIAATGGMLFSLHIGLAAIALFTFSLTVALTHYVSLGSLLIYVCFLPELIAMGQCGVFGMDQRHLNEMYLVAFALLVLAFWMHRGNIQRLRQGTERKTYLSRRKS